MYRIAPEPLDAAPQIDALLDRAFGPGRRKKTAQMLREGQQPAAGLSLIAEENGRLIGTIRFWHVRIGGRVPALLLGPVAVDSDERGRGIGAALVRRGLAVARAQGHGAVMLVGDEPYYRRFGFRAELARRMTLPGPVDRRRFLALELVPGALAPAAGRVHASGQPDPQRARRAA
jgi:predicted N-acetyltransferase YhbS